MSSKRKTRSGRTCRSAISDDYVTYEKVIKRRKVFDTAAKGNISERKSSGINASSISSLSFPEPVAVEFVDDYINIQDVNIAEDGSLVTVTGTEESSSDNPIRLAGSITTSGKMLTLVTSEEIFEKENAALAIMELCQSQKKSDEVQLMQLRNECEVVVHKAKTKGDSRRELRKEERNMMGIITKPECGTGRHMSIIQSLNDLDQYIQPCMMPSCFCGLYHCPLCDVDFFSPVKYRSGLLKHLVTHEKYSLPFRDVLCCLCRLPCSGCLVSHYHCPVCFLRLAPIRRIRAHLESKHADVEYVISTEAQSLENVVRGRGTKIRSLGKKRVKPRAPRTQVNDKYDVPSECSDDISFSSGTSPPADTVTVIIPSKLLIPGDVDAKIQHLYATLYPLNIKLGHDGNAFVLMGSWENVQQAYEMLKEEKSRRETNTCTFTIGQAGVTPGDTEEKLPLDALHTIDAETTNNQDKSSSRNSNQGINNITTNSVVVIPDAIIPAESILSLGNEVDFSASAVIETPNDSFTISSDKAPINTGIAITKPNGLLAASRRIVVVQNPTNDHEYVWSNTDAENSGEVSVQIIDHQDKAHQSPLAEKKSTLNEDMYCVKLVSAETVPGTGSDSIEEKSSQRTFTEIPDSDIMSDEEVSSPLKKAVLECLESIRREENKDSGGESSDCKQVDNLYFEDEAHDSDDAEDVADANDLDPTECEERPLTKYVNEESGHEFVRIDSSLQAGNQAANTIVDPVDYGGSPSIQAAPTYRIADLNERRPQNFENVQISSDPTASAVSFQLVADPETQSVPQNNDVHESEEILATENDSENVEYVILNPDGDYSDQQKLTLQLLGECGASDTDEIIHIDPGDDDMIVLQTEDGEVCIKVADDGLEILKTPRMPDPQPSNPTTKDTAQRFPCNQCNEVKHSYDAIYRHIRRVHGEKVFSCARCPLRFAIHSDMTRHAKTCKGLPDVPYCPTSMQTSGTYVCPLCGRTLGSRKTLRAHFEILHNNVLHRCDMCFKSFKCEKYLKAHKLRHSAEFIHQCTVCPKTFKYKSQIQEHLLTHMDNKDDPTLRKFHCNICDHRFVRRNALVDHMNLHEGKTPYECDVCGRKYAGRCALSKHKRAHSDDNPARYPCPYCEKEFKFRYQLKAHMVTHTRISDHQCQVCNRVYTTVTSLKNHNCSSLKTAKPSSVAFFMCSVCDATFMNWEEVVGHMATHTDDITVADSQEWSLEETVTDSDKTVDINLAGKRMEVDADGQIQIVNVTDDVSQYLKQVSPVKNTSVSRIEQSNDDDMNYNSVPVTE